MTAITSTRRAEFDGLCAMHHEMFLDGEYGTYLEYRQAKEDLAVEFFGSLEQYRDDCRDRVIAYHDRLAARKTAALQGKDSK